MPYSRKCAGQRYQLFQILQKGSARKTRKDYCQFLHIAYGSVSELETQLFLCKDLYNLPIQSELALITEVSKMLRVIVDKLEPSN